MVDVHVGVTPPALDQEVQEFHHGALFVGQRRGPKRLIAIFRRRVDAEQIFQSGLGRVIRIALHIEVYVARVGLGQQCETAPRVVRQEFEVIAIDSNDAGGDGLALHELQPRLLLEICQRRRVEAVNVDRTVAPPSCARVAMPARSSFAV